MNRETFLNSFGHVADAPGGVDKLRRLVLELAADGRLLKTDTAGWAISALPDVVRLDYGCAFESNYFNEVGQGLPLVRIRDVLPGTSSTFFSGAYEDRYLVEDGDYLIGMDGLFNLARWRGGTALLNQRVCRLGATVDSADVHYLAKYLPVALQRIHDQTSFVTVKHLSARALKAIKVPLPPLDEQRRIVERIDDLLALCEELEEQQAARVEARSVLTGATLHRITDASPVDDLGAAFNAFADNIGLHLAPGDGDLAALKRLRQTILDLAVRGHLTCQDPTDEPAKELLDHIALERDRLVKDKAIRKLRPIPSVDTPVHDVDLPRGWAPCRLGNLVLSSDAGWSPACLPSVRAEDTQWAVLKVSAVSWGAFRPDEHKLLTPGLDPRPQIEVHDGDFIMSRANTADLVGRSVVASEPPPRLMLSDKHVRLRFRDRVTAEFANIVNGGSSTRSYYAAVSTGTSDSMRNITRDQILALPIQLPPLVEQARIVNRVKELHAICDQLEQQLLAATSLRADLAASVVFHTAAKASRHEKPVASSVAAF